MVTLHALSLIVHLVCLAVLGAATLGGIVLDRSIWRALEQGHDGEALAHARTGAILGRFAQFAAIFMLLSGVGMLASAHFVLWGQHWLYGKLVLFVALAGYGGAVGGRASRRLMAILGQRAASAGTGAGTGKIDGELGALRSRLAQFHVVMPVMLVAVLVLVATRP
jgi:hypothetical protein